MHIRKTTPYLLLFLSLITPFCQALPPIPQHKAFTFSANMVTDDSVVLHWQIAKKTFLYQNRLKINFLDAKTNQIINFKLPQGEQKYNKLLGHYTVYTQKLKVPIYYTLHNPLQKATLKLSYQGCTEFGLCYPPATKYLTLDVRHHQVSIDNAPPKKQSMLSASSSFSHWLLTLLSFLGIGLLLSLTPCVLPMIPILSGIILGQQNLKTQKALMLSSLYVASMAGTYALIGILIARLGQNISIALQTPTVILLMSGLFCILALSLFGLFELKLPHALSKRLNNVNKPQKMASMGGVIIMGILATLIVSPCTTPALVGAIAYISQQQTMALGASALFVMGIGMGLPLILISTLGAKFSPKAGVWMNTIKPILGLIMLGLAIMMLNRLLPSAQHILLWSAYFIILAPLSFSLSLRHSTPKRIFHTMSIGLALPSALFGFYLLAIPYTAKLANNPSLNIVQSNQQTIYSLSELNKVLDSAMQDKKPVLIDFYANWCLDCKLMDATTFKHPQVQAFLKNVVLIRADVTKNTQASQDLMKKFNVIGPPTIILVNKKGQTIKHLVGMQSAKKLTATLKRIMPITMSS